MDAFKKLTRLKEHLQELSREEAYQLTKALLNNDMSIPRASAFLTAMRIKGESHEELMGAMRAIKEETSFIHSPAHLDLSLNYDGKAKSIYILPSAVFIASECGLKLSHHYADGVPAKKGVTFAQVLEEVSKALGTKAPVDMSHQREFSPKLYNLMPMRRELGFRTFINVLEKLVNPFGSERIITSLFHKPYFDKLYKLCSELGFESHTIVKGLEGGIEPLTDRVTYYSKNSAQVKSLEPKNLGLELPKSVQTEDVLGASLEVNLSVLQGKAGAGFTNWAILSAGLLLFAGDRVNSIREGYQLAKEGYRRLLNAMG